MSLNGKWYFLMVLTLVAVAPAAQAQARGRASAPASASDAVELGMDGGLSFGLDDPKTTTIRIPVQQIRAGFMLDEKMELEPFGALVYASGGGSSVTALNVGAGLLYHFQTVRSMPQVYVRPLASLMFASLDTGVGGSTSTTQFAFGAGLGVKRPFSDRLSWRFEGNFTHALASGDALAETSINLLAGLSFFTH